MRYVQATMWAMLLASLTYPGPVADAGQKGMGDPAGIGRQSEKPSVITMSGQLVEIKTGPCQQSTGKSLVGTHLIIQTMEANPINLHLGPASAVSHVVEQLSQGQLLTFEGFRTEQMPDNAYIAKSVTLNGKVVPLRDHNLRPTWASPGGTGEGRGPGTGRGRGRYGPCG